MNNFFNKNDLDFIDIYEKEMQEKRNQLYSSLSRSKIFLDAFNDPDTIEIMLNPDCSLWQEKLGCNIEKIGTLDPQMTLNWFSIIAGFRNLTINSANPRLECDFPLDGSRFTCVIPPVVNSPTFSLRKHASMVFTLEQYLEDKILSKKQYDFLINILKNANKNILVVGRPGSGKTTLTNALIRESIRHFPNDRYIIIEDAKEIQCTAKNHVKFLSNELFISMLELIRTAMRMRSDRILVGEVRGEEALALLDAWNTGNGGGIATLHANNAFMALQRLNALISRHKNAPANIDALIGEVVNYIVYIRKDEKNKKLVDTILEIGGWDYDKQKFIFKTVLKYND